MLKSLTITVSLMSVAGVAAAQTWTNVVTADGISFEYDATSVQRSGESVTVQTRAVYSTPQPYHGPGGAVLGQVALTHETMRFDCSARTYTDEAFTAKAADGSVIYSQGPQDPEPIAAGSSAAAFAEALCS